MKTSQLDADVRNEMANKEHLWDTITDSEGNLYEYCTRCGKYKTGLKLDDGTFLPCRGFI